MSNAHEESRRADKAIALADAWVHFAQTNQDEPVTAEVLDRAIACCELGDWSLAIGLAGVNPPSEATRLLCRRFLEERRRLLGTDPTEGLPR